MRIDQFFKNRSLSDSKPEINIIEWITLDENDQLTPDQIHECCMKFIRNEPMPGILEYADPICVRKSFAVPESVDFLLEDEEIPFPDSRYLQIQHPNTSEWHLIDREKGRITKCQENFFNDIPVIRVKK